VPPAGKPTIREWPESTPFSIGVTFASFADMDFFWFCFSSRSFASFAVKRTTPFSLFIRDGALNLA
jgi:hypothetical protein